MKTVWNPKNKPQALQNLQYLLESLQLEFVILHTNTEGYKL